MLRFKLGDVEAGFREADRIFEHTFRTQLAHQGYLEPHAGVVAIDGDGRVQVWASNKMPYRLKELMSHALKLPQERIRVNLTPIGGDFGGKGSLMDLPLAYHLARVTGRPVKMVMRYAEELMAGNPRHPSIITLRTGVTSDGRIVARQVKALFNSGAYAAFKPAPTVHLGGAGMGAGVYRIPNLLIESYCVYTHNIPCGHARSPGEPQMVFAGESHMDMIAQELGLDPAEFRRRNLLQDGDQLANGHHLEEVRARETLEAALEASHWSEPKPGPWIGRGVAMTHRHIGVGFTNARVRLETTGTVTLLIGLPDTGTGAHLTLRQVVAEVLGLAIEEVQVELATTDVFENDSGVGGSRVTHTGGRAAYNAAETVEGDDRGGSGAASASPGASLATIAQAAAREGRTLEASHFYDAKTHAAVTSFTAQVAEVAVDPATGPGERASLHDGARRGHRHQPDRPPGTDRGRAHPGARLRADGGAADRGRPDQHAQPGRGQAPDHRRRPAAHDRARRGSRWDPDRSAPRPSARAASARWRRPSPTPSPTRAGCASSICPSPRRRSTSRSRRREQQS